MRNKKSKICDKYEGQPAYVDDRYLTFIFVTAAKKVYIPHGTYFRVLKEILQCNVNGNSPPPLRENKQTNKETKLTNTHRKTTKL